MGPWIMGIGIAVAIIVGVLMVVDYYNWWGTSSDTTSTTTISVPAITLYLARP